MITSVEANIKTSIPSSKFSNKLNDGTDTLKNVVMNIGLTSGYGTSSAVEGIENQMSLISAKSN